MWFEEWRDWKGVEKHGETAYGKKFHSVLDEYIEEEWTFYQAPFDDLPASFDPRQQHCLPSGVDFFNSTNPHQRGSLEVVHAKTDSNCRHAIFEAYIEAQSKKGAPLTYTILLENRFNSNEFVMLAEMCRDVSLPPPGAGVSPQEWPGTKSETFSRQVSRIADCSHLRFGPALWPEDWDAVSATDPFPLRD